MRSKQVVITNDDVAAFQQVTDEYTQLFERLYGADNTDPGEIDQLTADDAASAQKNLRQLEQKSLEMNPIYVAITSLANQELGENRYYIVWPAYGDPWGSGDPSCAIVVPKVTGAAKLEIQISSATPGVTLNDLWYGQQELQPMELLFNY